MATISLPYGIASVSGKIGNIVFYHRNGKQYARRLSKSRPMESPEAIVDLLRGKLSRCRTVTESSPSHHRAITVSDQSKSNHEAARG